MKIYVTENYAKRQLKFWSFPYYGGRSYSLQLGYKILVVQRYKEAK